MVNTEPSRMGNYRISEKISKSGCAIIYKALDSRDRPLVIKCAKTRDAKNHPTDIYNGLLHRECEALQELWHPGVVHLYPINTQQNVTYIAQDPHANDKPWYVALEFIQGQHLAAYLPKIAKLPIEWRLELFYQLLLIVDYLHSAKDPARCPRYYNGLAHCDLKPMNIMLRADPDQYLVPNPVLIDFGTCSEVSKLTSQPSASIPYTAPEMLAFIHAKEANQSTDNLQIIPAKVDVYALGIIFAELMTGKEYMSHLTKEVKASKIIAGENPSLNQIDPTLAKNLNDYFWHMAARDPHHRKTVPQLIKALDEYLAPPPRLEKPRQGWLR